MDLFLEVVMGAHKGTRYQITDGASVGRLDGEIALEDPKISSSHASIHKNDRGKFVLTDNNSSNGLLINGQKVQKAILLPGVVIQLGQTFLKVIQDKDAQVTPLTPQKTWKEYLKDNFIKGGVHLQAPTKDISLFDPAIQLKFTQGIQADQTWEVAYGPRHFGKASLEFPLMEPNCPDQCFILRPQNSMVEFATPHPNKVLLNNEERPTEKIEEGDQIRIGQTLIEIKFIKS